MPDCLCSVAKNEKKIRILFVIVLRVFSDTDMCIVAYVFPRHAFIRGVRKKPSQRDRRMIGNRFPRVKSSESRLQPTGLRLVDHIFIFIGKNKIKTYTDSIYVRISVVRILFLALYRVRNREKKTKQNKASR